MFRRAEGRDHQLLALLLLLGVAIAMLPLWVPRLLPFLDLPNHLAAISIWNHYHVPEWGYQKYYLLSTPLVPYWGYYFPVHVLSYIFQIETANKVFLSFYAASIPFSVALAAKQFNRNPWVSILSLPFIFNYNLMYGFISYCAGLPCMLVGLVDEAEWAARSPAPCNPPSQTGFGRELFANFRRHAGGAEQGACTWL